VAIAPRACCIQGANRTGEIVPLTNPLLEVTATERLLASLEKLETACSKIADLEQRFSDLERAFADLRHVVAGHPAKELYSIEEFAKIIKRQPYTVREWCRLGRVRARKSWAGRGGGAE
jgi:hypothetical protein